LKKKKKIIENNLSNLLRKHDKLSKPYVTSNEIIMNNYDKRGVNVFEVLFENMQNVKDSRHNTKPFIGIELNID
jgi:hypothetical protein